MAAGNGNGNASEIYTETVEVGPALAEKWLEQNLSNRDIKDNVVMRFMRIIEQKKWKLTHQGIAFDWNSKLQDGQHRLWAIVLTGQTVSIRVTYNVDPESSFVIDTGRSRSGADVLTIAGRPVAHNVNATVSFLFEVITGRAPENEERIEFFDQYEKGIRFAWEDCFGGRGRRGITQAPVTSVFARCFYAATDKHEKVKYFAQVLCEGVSEGGKDKAIIMLRNFLSEPHTRKPGQRYALVAYRKTERALVAFLTAEQIKILYELQTEAFPLPAEHRWSSLSKRDAKISLKERPWAAKERAAAE